MTTLRQGALLALAVALVVAGLAAVYVRTALAEPQAFADRSVAALRSDAVQAVIAEEVAVDVLERQSPDLVAARPLVVTAIEAVLQTRQFEGVFRRAAVTAHGVLLRGNTDVAVELGELRKVLVPAVRTASPELARSLPKDLRPQIATIRRTDVASAVTRTADRTSSVAWPLLGVGVLGIVAVVVFAADRRRAVLRAGVALTTGGLLGALALSALGTEVISHARAVGVISDDDAREAARATWNALAGDLRSMLLALGGLGALLCASVVIADRRIDRAWVLRGASTLLGGQSLPVAARVARGLAAAVLGAVVLFDTGLLARILVAAFGVAIVLAGLAEVVAPLRTARRARPAAVRRRVRRRVLVGGVAAAVLAGGAAAASVLIDGNSAHPLAPAEVRACNGLPQLCDRRLDQVVFPATHNSMSAADRPGWLFANQRRPIPRQLQDGIRLLMVDPHYGVVNREGRIRTDLAAEGTTRNRVAAELGTDAIGAAEQLAGRLGLVPSDGKRKIYLCHSLCELGAESFAGTLKDVRGFLEQHRSEVVILMLESSVDPTEIEEAFDKAGLEDYLATLPRTGPMPRLKDLITTGRRLIVLDEHDGGDEPWYPPAFVLAQNTSIDKFTDDPSSCAPGRGSPDNPLLIVNHWVDRFPPPAARAAKVNTAKVLRARVKACEKRLGRGPNAIAVDFYQRGDLLRVVRDLNRDGV